MRPFAKPLRSSSTDAERMLWRHLRSRQLADFKFRRQQVIAPYIVDFVCMERRLVVEVDGGQHAERQRKDADRTTFLEAAGFQVIRFWNNEVLANLDGVMSAIQVAFTSTPHPSPLPQGEREKSSQSSTAA